MPPIQIQQTEHDHIPEEFSIESLKEGGMTDQEIEALSSGDDPIVKAEDPAPAEPAAEGDPDAQAALGASEPPAQAAEPAPAADPAPAAAEATPAPAADAPPAEPVSVHSNEEPAPAEPVDPFAHIKQPVLTAPADVTAHEKTVETTTQELLDLSAKYENGDIEATDFSTKQQEIINRQIEAKSEINKAEHQAQTNQQAAEDYWYQHLDAYKGLGTEALFEEEHVGGFDRHLRTVTSNRAYDRMPHGDKIKLAHNLYAAEYQSINGKPLGIAVPGETVAQADPAPEPSPDPAPQANAEPTPQAKADEPAPQADEPPKHEVRTDPRPAAPQTLAGINSDNVGEIEDSKFAAVDRQIMKDPILAEEMVANFSGEEMQRFLEGA